jgi:hypothetical protein
MHLSVRQPSGSVRETHGDGDAGIVAVKDLSGIISSPYARAKRCPRLRRCAHQRCITLLHRQKLITPDLDLLACKQEGGNMKLYEASKKTADGEDYNAINPVATYQL